MTAKGKNLKRLMCSFTKTGTHSDEEKERQTGPGPNSGGAWDPGGRGPY